MTEVAQALDIISRHQTATPVRVQPIAQDLGLKVYLVSGWPDGISGMLKADPTAPSGFAVYVNNQHSLVRQRFTIAHEIAHYVLHRDKIGDGLTDDALYRSGLSNAIEAAANKFAADLLMPWHLINAAINGGASTVQDLARTFDVSQTAMAIRLGVPNGS